jgi:hypothetical protein
VSARGGKRIGDSAANHSGAYDCDGI